MVSSNASPGWTAVFWRWWTGLSSRRVKNYLMAPVSPLYVPTFCSVITSVVFVHMQARSSWTFVNARKGGKWIMSAPVEGWTLLGLIWPENLPILPWALSVSRGSPRSFFGKISLVSGPLPSRRQLTNDQHALFLPLLVIGYVPAHEEKPQQKNITS